MPQISYRFYAPNANQVMELLNTVAVEVSLPRLIIAALTVGRPSWAAVLQHGRYSTLECTWRAAMIMSNVAVSERPDGTRIFEASQAFRHLDPSEKGAATFFIAGAMTKIVAEACGVPTLYHLDTLGQYAAFIGPNLPQVAMLAGGTRRPDFIGPNAAMMYGVFESKGRTHLSNDPLRVSAKEQTTMIDTINGHAPRCRIACITSFGRNQMTVEIVDPTASHKEAFSMSTENADLKEPFRLTQGLFHENVTHEETVKGTTFRMVMLEAADLEFGLRKDVYNALEFGSNADMEAQLKLRGGADELVFPDTLMTRLRSERDSKEAIASDGHFVRLGKSWERWMRSTDSLS